MPSGRQWYCFPATDTFRDMIYIDAMSAFDIWGECEGIDLRS